jgi:hypothetical protein
MLNKWRFLWVILFGILIFSIEGSPMSNPADYTIVKYYSTFLYLNLNHAIESSKVIYNLSKEDSFSIEFLESELEQLDDNIKYANIDISQIVFNTPEEKKLGLDESFKSIDKHLAQAAEDIKLIKKDFSKRENITRLMTDIFFQVKTARDIDYEAIKEKQNIKPFNEPNIINQ